MVVVQRVSVVGNSGSGKSTLAAALAGRLAVSRFELDSIYHQPGWNPLPAADFRARVSDPAWAHLRFVRLRSPAEVRGFLSGLPGRPR